MAVRLEHQAEPIPGYKLLERLGGGGFGEVWKATAPGGLHKAIKFVYGDLQAASEEGQRAEQELKALSRVKSVRHPYILSLERYDIIDGQLIIVMELADRNLWDRFRECRTQGHQGIPREELLRYMQETAEALDLMNIQYQLQHLDIKPQNLFLVHHHAKVADFGLVKDLEGMMASVTGGVTPVYAAPETFDGWISRFCDQYSLAIVYQELLTGQRPFTGTNVRQLILQHLQATPNLAPLPEGDREAIGRALAKNPDERFGSCQELVRALLHAGTGLAPISSRVPPEVPAETPVDPGMPANDSDPSRTPPARGSRDDVLADQDPGQRTPGSPTRTAALPAEPPEPVTVRPKHEIVHGDGVLFPALVVGLGHSGLRVLRALRQTVGERIGSPDMLPTLRLLYFDSDPSAPRLASRGHAESALEPHEVLLAKLCRPSHYLRAHDARTRYGGWFDIQMLYRIPRTLVTTGLRALGRLAFFDNYKSIVRRLDAELEDCTRSECLTVAAQETGLGMRTNRPRVYLVTHLGGGTGSGAFVDMAYALRGLLRNRGYDDAEIIGLFLLPAVDRNPARKLLLGNAFAALTELAHFSRPDTVFTARYDDKEKPVQSTGRPFDRQFFLVTPDGADDAPEQDVAALAAEFLAADLLTPVGRTADEERRALGPAEAGDELLVQSFGLYRLTWPRQAILLGVSRQACYLLAKGWMTKDASRVRDAIHGAAAEFWSQAGMTGEHLMGHLQKTCEAVLNQPADQQIEQATECLGSVNLQDLNAVLTTSAAVLARLDHVVGRPAGSVGACPGALADPLAEAARELTVRWGQRLAQFASQFIEQPGIRLAGAEEALRQLSAIIEQEITHYEPLWNDLTKRAAEALDRIGSLMTSLQTVSGPPNRKTSTAAANLLELVRFYPKWRYQSLLLQRLVATHVSLRGFLSDQLREMNFCRTRIDELARYFQRASAEAAEAPTSPSRRNLFPAGCRTVSDVVKQMLDALSPADFQELDVRAQAMINGQFGTLMHVCLTPSSLMQNLQASLQRVAQDFLNSRVAEVNVEELYQAEHADDEAIRADLASVYDEAAPEQCRQRPNPADEICVLAVPPTGTGRLLSELAAQAVPEANWTAAPSPEDIWLYRENPAVPLADLEQLGPLAQDAYRQMTTVEHFTPHSRNDIREWQSPVAVQA